MSRTELADACNTSLDARYRAQGRGQRWAGLTEKTIGALERGEVRWPNDDYRWALCTVLQADERALGLYIDRPIQMEHGERLAAESQHSAGSSLVAAVEVVGASVPYTVDEDNAFSPLDRLSSLSIETPLPASIGWADVEHVRYITRALALSENTYGGGFSGQAAAAQLRHSAQLVKARAVGDVRRAMYEAVGNLSGVVGFSAFDVADYRSARRCFNFSLWCAEQAGSWQLRASALGDMTRMAMYLGDHDNALSLIEHAQVRSDRLSATMRAMLSAVRAQLLALQGRHAEALSEVSRSDECFAARRPAEDPPWISYYDEAEHQGSTGRALIPIALHANDMGKAVGRLQAAVRLHDADHPRSRAFSQTRLASLMMRIGDPKEAVSVGRAVLVEASELRSSRLRAEMEALAALAAAHEGIPEVVDLRHEIIGSCRRVGAN